MWHLNLQLNQWAALNEANNQSQGTIDYPAAANTEDDAQARSLHRKRWLLRPGQIA